MFEKHMCHDFDPIHVNYYNYVTFLKKLYCEWLDGLYMIIKKICSPHPYLHLGQ